MNERISALMDGELGDRDAGHAIGDLETQAQARETWRTYHLISDVMRDARLLSPGFADRVAQRLAQEPTVLAPRRLKSGPTQRIALPAAAAASVAGVALVGWLALAPQQEAVVAEAPKPPVAAQVATVPLPSATPDYLFAHQGFSPRVSLQGMAPYARTVSSQANEGRK